MSFNPRRYFSAHGARGVSRAIENGAWNDASRERLSELESLQGPRAVPTGKQRPERRPQFRLYPNAAEIYRAKASQPRGVAECPGNQGRGVGGSTRADRPGAFIPAPDAPDRLRTGPHDDLAEETRDSAGPLRLGRGKMAGCMMQDEKIPGTTVPGNQPSLVAGQETTESSRCHGALPTRQPGCGRRDQPPAERSDGRQPKRELTRIRDCKTDFGSAAVRQRRVRL